MIQPRFVTGANPTSRRQCDQWLGEAVINWWDVVIAWRSKRFRPHPYPAGPIFWGSWTPTLRQALVPIILFVAASVAACANTGNRPSAASAPASRGVGDEKPSDAAPADQYVIGSGDSLSVFVYHNADLSEPAVSVRPDGRISVPLIEDITAAGKTPTQLARDIEVRLQKYIHDPNVTVIVRSFVGPFDRQIKVIGEATDPAAIPYREHMMLLDVMIATRGLTKYAAGNRAEIIRRGTDGKHVSIRVRLDNLIKDGDISQNIEMQPGDTLIIPQSWF
jgi:polysaccharide biosynthesis/export protein